MKAIILNDLKSNVTNLGAVNNDNLDTLSIILNVVSGSTVNIDQELIGYCQKIKDELQKANQHLNNARDLAQQLDVTEESGS